MDIDNMLDQLYETIKESDIPLILSLVHEGEVKVLMSGSGKNLSIMIASMFRNISKETGIPTSVILRGILHDIMIDEGSVENDG